LNQGEELRKQIGAMYYIECSSKTQQVMMNRWSCQKILDYHHVNHGDYDTQHESPGFWKDSYL